MAQDVRENGYNRTYLTAELKSMGIYEATSNDGEGRHVGTHGVIRDISDRKLYETRQGFRQPINSSLSHVVLDRAVAEAAFSETEAVLDRVDITSARLLNREVGFRIAAFDANSIFSEMGLRSGDLLLAINGREIAGPEEAASFFKTIREVGDIDLTVRRRARS